MLTESPPPTAVRSSVPDAIVRGALWLLALGIARFTPAWVAAPVVILAAAVLLDRLVRHRGRGVLDAALFGLTGAVLVCVGLGLVLNLLPVGLTRSSWIIGLALVGVLALALSARYPLPPSAFRPLLRQIPDTSWVFAFGAIVVIVLSIALSARVTRNADTPPLQMSASAVVDGHTSVTLSSGTSFDRMSLVVTTSNSSQVVVADLSVTPDVAQVVSVPVVADGRSTVELLDQNHTVIRDLIIDTTTRSTS